MRLFNDEIGTRLGQMRAIADRTFVVLLIVLSVALLVLGKADIKLVSSLTREIDDLAVPVLAALSTPVAILRAKVETVSSLMAAAEENRRLREENHRLLAWRSEAARLSVQNRALRRLLRMPPVEAAAVWTTARVVADSTGTFVRTTLIDAGADQGLVPGMAAMAPGGLAGRVVEVGRRSARVMLLTDYSSKIPVIIERSGVRALVEGDNSAVPALRFAPGDADLRSGDRVLTSGDGGLLPPGLEVGEVVLVPGRPPAVRPSVELEGLDYLSVLRAAALSEPASEPAPERRRTVAVP